VSARVRRGIVVVMVVAVDRPRRAAADASVLNIVCLSHTQGAGQGHGPDPGEKPNSIRRLLPSWLE
jgi:hypothetical protein